MVGNISITDVYMSVLSSLSVDEKPDLIAKLTNSIRNTYTLQLGEQEVIKDSDQPINIIIYGNFR